MSNEGGTLTLTGAVEWRWQALQAEQSLHHLPGLTQIENKIKIVQQPPGPDQTEQIAHALNRLVGVRRSQVVVQGTNGFALSPHAPVRR